MDRKPYAPELLSTMHDLHDETIDIATEMLSNFEPQNDTLIRIKFDVDLMSEQEAEKLRNRLSNVALDDLPYLNNILLFGHNLAPEKDVILEGFYFNPDDDDEPWQVIGSPRHKPGFTSETFNLSDISLRARIEIIGILEAIFLDWEDGLDVKPYILSYTMDDLEHYFKVMSQGFINNLNDDSFKVKTPVLVNPYGEHLREHLGRMGYNKKDPNTIKNGSDAQQNEIEAWERNGIRIQWVNRPDVNTFTDNVYRFAD